MSSSGNLPKHIEDVLVTHRRGFLKSAGLLAVSFGVFGSTAIEQGAAQSGEPAASPGPYHDPDFH
jgi:hypothetical protein